MAKKSSRLGFTPLEYRISALPSSVAGIIVIALMTYHGIVLVPETKMKAYLLLVFGILAILYVAGLDLWIIPSASTKRAFGWANIVIATIGTPGGCNPIPLKSRIEGGTLIIDESALDVEKSPLGAPSFRPRAFCWDL